MRTRAPDHPPPVGAVPGASAANPLQPGSTRTRLRSLAEQIGATLTEPRRVRQALDADPGANPLRPVGLGSGALGIVLALSELHLAGLPGRWDAAAVAWARTAMRATVRAGHLSPGLNSGTAGYVVALRSLATWHAPSRSVLERFVDLLAEQALDRPRPGAHPAHPADVDLLYGVSGMVMGLLDAQESDAGRAGSRERVAAAVERSIEDLTHYAEIDGGRPRALYPADAAPVDDRGDRRVTASYVDLGMAHGVPGVISALSRLVTAGHSSPRMAAALAELAGWLVDQGTDRKNGRDWPYMVFPDEPGTNGTSSRTAWCYGAPGVALALHRAGVALSDDALRDRAYEVARTLPQRCTEDPRLTDAGLCHGVAGIAVAASLAGSRADLLGGLLVDACHRLPGLDGQPTRQTTDHCSAPDASPLTGSSGVVLAALHASGPGVSAFDRGSLLG